MASSSALLKISEQNPQIPRELRTNATRNSEEEVAIWREVGGKQNPAY